MFSGNMNSRKWMLWIIFIGFLSSAATYDEDEASIRMTELCSSGDIDLKCADGQVLKLGSIVCGGGSHPCAPGTNATIFTVCDSQNSCTTLGLKTMIQPYCDAPTDTVRQIHVTYRCVLPVSRIPCKSNICQQDNKGLQCHFGGVIHILGANCLDGVSPCSWPIFVSLYTLCEGQDACAASGLRMVMPTYCSHPKRALRNVHVDYVCVPRNKIENKCSKEFKEMTDRFGVLMNPGYTGGTSTEITSEQCYWLIRQHPGTIIKVKVHLAYRKEGMPKCNLQFLQIRFTDCRTMSSKISSFCDLKKVNQKFDSCGDVYITSFLPPSIEDTSDRFLVSYEVVNDTVSLRSIDGITACGPDIPLMTSSTTANQRARVSGMNYGSKVPAVDHTNNKPNDLSETDDTRSAREAHAGITLRLKLVILYVFFGIVIIALVIALIFVVVSYRGVAQKGQYKVEASEKVALWKNEDTTHIDHTQHNSIAENSNPSELTTPGSQTEHTIATVHAMTPVEGNKRFTSCGRFSSFRDDEDGGFSEGMNDYASYSTINNDNIAPKSNRASEDKAKRGMAPTPEEQPLVLQNGLSSPLAGVDHYTINDDDYAIVRKSKKPPKNVKETNVDDVDPTYDNLFEEDMVGFKPTSGPYDKNRDSGMEFNIRFSSFNGWKDDL